MAIYNNESSTNSIRKLPKQVRNFAKILNRPFAKVLYNFAKVGKISPKLITLKMIRNEAKTGDNSPLVCASDLRKREIERGRWKV